MNNKQTSLDFLHLCAAGQAHRAFPLYAAPDFGQEVPQNCVNENGMF